MTRTIMNCYCTRIWLKSAIISASVDSKSQFRQLHPSYSFHRVKRHVQKRLLTSDAMKGGPTNDAKASTTWERGAIAVKNVDVTNPYLESIRRTHDPALHLKTLEDELKGTIGQALGKQGQKILMWMKVMEQDKQTIETMFQAGGRINVDALEKVILSHNDARNKAITARWELVVHRQAAGFIVNNHKFVHEMFRIGEKLSVSDFESSNLSQESNEHIDKQKEKFGDQLDWWQRVGRWK